MPSITLNGLTADVAPRSDEPLVMTQEIAATESPSGEKLQVLTNPFNPMSFIVRGEKNYAVFNVEPLVQEVLLHVLRENEYPEERP